MKKSSPISAAAIAIYLLFSVPIFSQAQSVKSWNFGVSADMTTERFAVTRKFKNQNQMLPNQEYKARSWGNFGAGIWAEWRLSSTFSLVPQLAYNVVHINDNILAGGLAKSGSGDDVKETHHYVSSAIHLRKYFQLNPKLRLFADAGIKADRLVYFKLDYWRYKSDIWNPAVSKNINPAIVLAAGIKRGRWALSAEYQYFLGSPLVKKYRGDLEVTHMETNLERQNLGLKAAFALRK